MATAGAAAEAVCVWLLAVHGIHAHSKALPAFIHCTKDFVHGVW
jgi:hypothetical protein